MPEKMSRWETERFINQMIEIEDFVYDSIESHWTNFTDISYQLCQSGLYLKDRLLDGFQAYEIVKDLCLGFYTKIWKHYRDPNFRDMLDPLEKHYPDRSEYQIAVVKDIHNPGKYRVRKLLFKRFAERYPVREREPYVEPTNVIRKLSQHGTEGVYFYGECLRDPKKIWIDPGAIEYFLKLLFHAKKANYCVHKIINGVCPEYLKSHWFIIPEKQEYHAHYLVAKLTPKLIEKLK